MATTEFQANEETFEYDARGRLSAVLRAVFQPSRLDLFHDVERLTRMEVWLGGRWYVFDPRNNSPRVGRVLVARCRDAADVPLTHTFGPNTLVGFRVWIDEAASGGDGLR